MRIAYFSDVRYGVATLEEAGRCFGAAIDRAIAEGVEAAVLSGDATDHGLDLHEPATRRLCAQGRRPADHCPVLMLQGTFSHEPPGTPAAFGLLGPPHPFPLPAPAGPLPARAPRPAGGVRPAGRSPLRPRGRADRTGGVDGGWPLAALGRMALLRGAIRCAGAVHLRADHQQGRGGRERWRYRGIGGSG